MSHTGNKPKTLYERLCDQLGYLGIKPEKSTNRSMDATACYLAGALEVTLRTKQISEAQLGVVQVLAASGRTKEACEYIEKLAS